ncbi:hypothetical protein TL16_g11206 [Triparma laevis f. inornata]|nr:hypothetical protein TL16_g11206 [Triparma laevis f. inornata]GMI02756.1 hypothetical protein TrLO_g5670 [Triparma laevis f. longispina]
MESSHNDYLDLLTHLRLSSDYQSLEYYSLTVTHLKSKGLTLEDMNSCVSWQIESMKAYSESRIPPQPSKKVMSLIQSQQNPPMLSVPSITSPPFTLNEPILQDPVIKKTLEDLIKDHEQLINFGANYGSFDPLGKLAYITEIEKIEDRWFTFLGRLELMNVVSPKFKEETGMFLEGMGLEVGGFYELMDTGKEWMRDRAEENR